MLDDQRYRRLLDGRRTVEVYYEREVPGALVRCGGRCGTWLRGGSVLTLLAVPQPDVLTGSLFRRIRRRRMVPCAP
jgi:hypothetical protein